MPIHDYLIDFRERFPITKVLHEQDHLIYIFDFYSDASRVAAKANMLIQQAGWPLAVLHTGNNSFFIVKGDDSFYI